MIERHRPAALTIAFAIVAGLLVLAPRVTAQSTSRPADTEDLPAPTPAEGTVEVHEQARDADIEVRIRSILDTTELFDDLDVRVRNGVVFLDGTARSNEDKKWASELVRRTRFVVAVVNDLGVEDPMRPLWDFSEATDTIESMSRAVVRSLPLVVIGLVILVLTIFGSKIASRVAENLLRRRISNVLVRSVVVKIIVLVVILAGVYVFLRISGLTRLAVTVLGGTGVLGLILGFAFRDIAENFLASLLISVERPFRIGDTIEVADHVGIVRRVTTRGTLLIDFDGNHILISNSTVFKSTLVNYSINPKMRVRFQVGIGYDSDVPEARRIALEVMQKHSAVLNDPEPLVLLENLGGASIVLELAFWINAQEHSKLKVRSSVMRQVVAALDAAGVSLPDEDREVVFANPLEVQMRRKSESEDEEATSSGATTAKKEDRKSVV